MCRRLCLLIVIFIASSVLHLGDNTRSQPAMAWRISKRFLSFSLYLCINPLSLSLSIYQSISLSLSKKERLPGEIERESEGG